jgi:4-cresol dehydrogenase (hydroxylating) flavoprotein subunit
VHSGNSTRTLMTSSQFPKECDPASALNEKQCQNILNKGSLIHFGTWTSIGAFYGFNNEVDQNVKRLKQSLKGIAKIRIFTDQKLALADRILNMPILRKIDGLNAARKSFETLKALHGILRGQPSHVPSNNIYWRVQEKSNLGLAWFSPVIPATAQDAAFLIKASRAIYEKYNLEMPITLTLINEKKMTAVYNICFDKSKPEEVKRAHQAYLELSSTINALGYQPYRLGILSDAKAAMGEKKLNFLNTLKRALDPNNIMAPGRYGIDIAHSEKDIQKINEQRYI